MKEIVRLDEIAPGECATVHELRNEGHMRRRLCDLGLVEGAEIVCVGKSPSGDPRAYLICGAVIAIRRADSAKITVQRKKSEARIWD